MNFNEFGESFFKDIYPKKHNIFCIFDTSEYSESEIELICLEASQHVTHGFLFQTSGTTSNKKFVLHDFESIKASCESVNQWVLSDKEDNFLVPISMHHMGGFSLLARSVFAHAKKPYILKTWSLKSFLEVITQEESTVTSMVPSQIYEIVQAKVECPPSLKTIFVGGSAIDHEIYLQAKKLKWPLLKTFGSAEACSQIFTQKRDLHIHSPSEDYDESLFLLSHWKVKTNEDQRLQIKGPSIFKGYLILKQGMVKFAESPRDDSGYFITEDMVKIKDNKLENFLGRINDYVKINSTLVHLESFRKSFYTYCSQIGLNPERIVISTQEDLKSGLTLVAYTELFTQGLIEKLEHWNQNHKSSERLRGIYYIQKIPRTELGKVKYKELNF